MRVVHVRTGIVQSPRGGTLRLLRPLFAAGLGGRLGSGDQWTPWIGIDDLVDVYYRAVLDPELSGPVNAVAPTPVRNREYSATLARVLHRPAVVPVPAFGPGCCSAPRGLPSWPRPASESSRSGCSAAGHPFRYGDWSRPCGTCSGAPRRAEPPPLDLQDHRD